MVHPLVHRLLLMRIWSRGRRYPVYMKLDPVKAERIVEQKRKKVLAIKEMAGKVGVSPP